LSSNELYSDSSLDGFDSDTKERRRVNRTDNSEDIDKVEALDEEDEI
jgi:hypothetical protein